MTFEPAELSLDGFLGGRLQILQPRSGYRAATDPVFLAAFTQVEAGDLLLDLGCGVGTAGLCVARRVPGVVLHGLELQPAYAELARRNAEANGIPSVVHEGDLLAPPQALRGISFDHVIMNPPFYVADAATGAHDPGRDRAHRETLAAGLDLWISAGMRRLRQGGSIVIVHRAERLAEILAALNGPAGAIEILPLVPRVGRPANRVLVRARKARKTPLSLYSPLTIHEGKSHIRDGEDYTENVVKVLRELSGLLLNSR